MYRTAQRNSGNAPPWVTRPWDETKTLFEILGVPEYAEAFDIQNAYAEHIAHAGHVDRLPPGVEYAFKTLYPDQRQRDFYRTLLDWCRSMQPIHVPPQGVQKLLIACERFRIRCWKAKDGPEDEYHLRLPGQPEPEAARENQEQAQQEAWELERKREHLRRPITTLLVRLGYGFGILCLLALAFTWTFDGTFSRWLRVLGVMEEREARAETKEQKQLAKQERESLALANDAIAMLDAELSSLRAAVQRETGVSLDAGQVPDELISLADNEPTVKKAWTEIRNAYSVRGELTKRQPILNAVNGRFQQGVFFKADIETLDNAKKWATDALQTVNSQSKNISHVKSMLEADRFKRAGDAAGKEH